MRKPRKQPTEKSASGCLRGIGLTQDEPQDVAALRGIFDEIIAQHVADRHVRIFDPAVVF